MIIRTVLKNKLTLTPVTLERLGDGTFALQGWEFALADWRKKTVELGKSFPTGKELVRIAREYFDGDECAHEIPTLEDLF